MTELSQKIHDDSNSLDYTLAGDYYIPDLQITEEHRSIGIWGSRHREYLRQRSRCSLPSSVYPESFTLIWQI